MECHELESHLIDDFAGELTAERSEALMAHLEACAACRGTYQDFQLQDERLSWFFKRRMEVAVERMTVQAEFRAGPAAAPSHRIWRMGIAAMLVLGFALGVVSVVRNNVPMGDSVVAEMRQVDGRVMVFDEGVMRPVAMDAGLRQDQRIKIPSEGYVAIELPSDNLLEARGGTQLTLRDFPHRFVVDLNRGQVIVHLSRAADKRIEIVTEHLTVALEETGVFAIEDGLDRTVVTVERGAATIRSGRRRVRLTEGESFSTRRGTLIRDRLAMTSWTRNPFEGSMQLAAREDAIRPLRVETSKRLEREPFAAAQFPVQAARQDLIDYLPEGTIALVDVSDWRSLLDEFLASDYARLGEEAGFKEWIESLNIPELEQEMRGDWRIEELNDISRLIDGQLVVSISRPEGGDASSTGFLMIAETGANEVAIRRGLDTLVDGTPELEGHAVVVGGRLIVSSDTQLVIETIARLIDGRTTAFTGSGFYQTIQANAIDPGNMVATDLAWLVGQVPADQFDRLQFFGLDSLDYLLVSPTFHGGGLQQAARIGFSERRGGVMNWLAEPGPMRGLDFFSPGTHFVATALVRSPRTLFLDHLEALRDMGYEDQARRIREVYEEHEVVFNALGGEIAIGLDSPILPTPNFKLVLEILDPAAFETHLIDLIEELTRIQTEFDQPIERIERTYRGIRIHSLSARGIAWQPSFAIVEDYLIIAPGPEFVWDAIDIFESRQSIARDPKFLALLPEDGDANVSALVYQNVGGAIRDLAESADFAIPNRPEYQFLKDETWLERYGAPGVIFASAMPTHIDVYTNTGEGVDFNLAVAGPLLAAWLLPALAEMGEDPPPALEASTAGTYNDTRTGRAGSIILRADRAPAPPPGLRRP